MRPFLLVGLVLAVSPPASGAAPVGDPNDPRNLTWIAPGVLALGGGGLTGEDVAWLDEAGFGAIADVRAEHEDPADLIAERGMAFLDIPVDHAVDMNASQLRTFVSWAQRMRDEGRPIYVHCTNGWHRAAAFAAAWLMANDPSLVDADRAFARVAELRPGSVLRAPSALLAYEAELEGERPLVVLLKSPVARPERGGSMPVEVEVLAAGAPARGARVHVWSEESRLDAWGTADEDGRFRFTYVADLEQPMDHLYARAWFEGFENGADDVELFYASPVPTSRPLDIQTSPEGSLLAVRVLRNGEPHPARIVAWNDLGWSTFDETGTGVATLPFPGEDAPIHIRAESWGTLGDETVARPPRARGEERLVPHTTPRADVWATLPPPARSPDAPPAPGPVLPVVLPPEAVPALAVLAGAMALGSRSARRRPF